MKHCVHTLRRLGHGAQVVAQALAGLGASPSRLGRPGASQRGDIVSAEVTSAAASRSSPHLQASPCSHSSASGRCGAAHHARSSTPRHGLEIDSACHVAGPKRPATALLPRAHSSALPQHQTRTRNGRVRRASTDDRLTLASGSDCESANVVVRHDCRSSQASVSAATADTLAFGLDAAVLDAGAIDSSHCPVRRTGAAPPWGAWGRSRRVSVPAFAPPPRGVCCLRLSRKARACPTRACGSARVARHLGQDRAARLTRVSAPHPTERRRRIVVLHLRSSPRQHPCALRMTGVAGAGDLACD
jgi:hypothetical protein